MSSGQSPEYKTTVVSLIDILGFSERINSGQQESLRLAIDYLNALKGVRKIMDPWCNYEPLGTFSTHMFSDMVLRVRGGYHPEILMSEISDLAEAILHLLDKGVVIRGAVVCGNHYQDYKNNVFVSPALIEAHRYESQICKVPRVIISPDAFGILEKYHAEFSGDDSPILSMETLIRLDSDGYHFIDYLRSTHTYGNRWFMQVLQKHHDLIVSGVENPERNIASKYIWLGNYHNAYVSEILKSAPEGVVTNYDCINWPENWRSIFRGLLIPPKLLRQR